MCDQNVKCLGDPIVFHCKDTLTKLGSVSFPTIIILIHISGDDREVVFSFQRISVEMRYH